MSNTELKQSFLKEHDNAKDQNGKMQIVYKVFGCTMFTVSILENAMSALVWSYNLKDKKINYDTEEGIEIVKKYSKQPMGFLLGKIKEYELLDEKKIGSLELLINDRNFLTHHFFKENTGLIYTDSGRRKMISGLCDWLQEFNQCTIRLRPTVIAKVKECGLGSQQKDFITKNMKEQEDLKMKM